MEIIKNGETGGKEVKMYRISILGSDNSHALAFSKIANLKNELTGEYDYPDFRVTGIFGLDTVQAGEVAKKAEIGFVADNVQEMVGRTDAAMVVFRHGGLHARYAMPFIEAGIPVWIDKPFTIDIEEAKSLIAAAKKKNVLIMGGSNLKLAYDVLMLKNSIQNKSIGSVVSGVLNFPADFDNEYGGLFFYGPHLVEMALTVFGYDVISVSAYVHNGQLIAIIKYKEYQVVLNFTKNCPQHFGIIYGTKRTVVREIDISIIYRLGFAEFVQNIRCGSANIDEGKILMPVQLLNAIMESIDGNREIKISDIS